MYTIDGDLGNVIIDTTHYPAPIDKAFKPIIFGVAATSGPFVEVKDVPEVQFEPAAFDAVVDVLFKSFGEQTETPASTQFESLNTKSHVQGEDRVASFNMRKEAEGQLNNAAAATVIAAVNGFVLEFSLLDLQF